MSQITPQSQQRLFILIGLSIPVIFLFLIEITLRFMGYAEHQPLFIENPSHKDYLLPRPDIINRYFAEGAAPNLTLEPTFFLKEKPHNGYRVFVQGGSTAAGFPYGLGASLAGMLDQRLRQTFTSKHVEVVNVSMSAVNSYFLLDTAEEIIEQQPDAVVIYAGHNEYLGVFGAGSNFAQFEQPSLMRAFFILRKLALFDAIQQLIFSFGKEIATQSNPRTFMSQAAKHKVIERDSALYQTGISQFKNNMSELLTKYQQAGIPVYISTIASNIKDQKPFSSEQAKKAYSAGISLLAENDISRATKELYKAKELDSLRFRAPEEINSIIRAFSSLDNVTVFDSEKRMRERSPNSLIGNNLMLEHLHPNVPGYFLIADTAYEALMLKNNIKERAVIDTNAAWRSRPITVAEEYYGFAQIQALLADYPFSQTKKKVQLPKAGDWQQALGRDYYTGKLNWLQMMKTLHQGYIKRNDAHMAMKTLQLIADAQPQDPVSNIQLARGLQQLGRLNESEYYTERAKRAGFVGTQPIK